MDQSRSTTNGNGRASGSADGINGLHLRIIQWNDVYELENFPHLKTLIDENTNKEGERSPTTTLVIMAGDFLAPSLLSALDKGRGMVDSMNMCGFTHACFGNHETDIPMDQLAQRILSSKFRWLNTNMRELDDKLGVDTVPHDIVEVSDGTYTKRVGLLGLLTEDDSLYRPGAFDGATIEPVLETAIAYMKNTIDPLGLDLVIPLTHQLMCHDQTFAKHFTGESFPLILGGHDHEPFDETHNGSRILKTGHDGINTAIIDIRWGPVAGGGVAGKPTIAVDMIETSTYPPCPTCTSRVKAHQRVLAELERAKLFQFEDWKCGEVDAPFTSENNRLGPTNGSSILTTMLRMGMRADCGIMNAGGIRGNKTYPIDQEWFTWSDLKNEIQFSTEMVDVHLPGKVISDTLAHSRRFAKRNPPAASGGYLHHCDQIVYNDETGEIEMIRGEPMVPDRLYWCSMPAQFFEGIDNHQPLLEWAKSINKEEVFRHGGKPAKVVIVETFAALLWLHMGSFSEIDKDGDGVLEREEVKERAKQVFGDEVVDLVLESIMSVADVSGNGYITPLDMAVVKFVATDMVDHVVTQDELKVMREVVGDVLGKRPSHDQVKKVVRDLRSVLDIERSGHISRREAMQALGEVRRKSLLI